jgi:hypothetical protein
MRSMKKEQMFHPQKRPRGLGSLVSVCNHHEVSSCSPSVEQADSESGGHASQNANGSK